MFYVSMYNQRARLIEPKHPLTPLPFLPAPFLHLFTLYLKQKRRRSLFYVSYVYNNMHKSIESKWTIIY